MLLKRHADYASYIMQSIFNNVMHNPMNNWGENNEEYGEMGGIIVSGAISTAWAPVRYD